MHVLTIGTCFQSIIPSGFRGSHFIIKLPDKKHMVLNVGTYVSCQLGVLTDENDHETLQSGCKVTETTRYDGRETPFTFVKKTENYYQLSNVLSGEYIDIHPDDGDVVYVAQNRKKTFLKKNGRRARPFHFSGFESLIIDDSDVSDEEDNVNEKEKYSSPSIYFDESYGGVYDNTQKYVPKRFTGKYYKDD
jgi:hypothetical protein